MKILLRLISILLTLVSSRSWAGEKYDLLKCYELAVNYAESVKISEQEINVARARFHQALGRVLPLVTFRASEFLQDSSSSGPPDTVQETFTQFGRPEVSLNVQQPLFQGLKEYTALKLSKVDTQRAEWELKNTKRLLLQDVAIAFFTITTIERNIADTVMIIDVVQKRVKDLQHRIFLGKSREGESTQEEAFLALLRADLEKKKGEENVAYEMMSFLTGLQPMPPIDWKNSIPNQGYAVEYYLDQAGGRPDVMAVEKEVLLAKGNVKIVRGDFLPAVNAEFNYYAVRSGFQSDIKWDALLSADVPIFNWTNVGRLKEAQARAKQADMSAENTRRIAATEIRRAFDNLQSSKAQFLEYEKAVGLSHKNFNLQNKDFNIGLAENLDVLTAQRTWLESLNQRNLSEVKTWLDWVNLQIVSGALP